MRQLSIIILSFALTACSSLGGGDAENNSSVFKNIPKKVEYKGTLFAQYLKDYLAKNIHPRSIASRNLIDRSDIESKGRLPSKALYQSLGYRVRDAFVVLPPELSTRSIINPEDILLAQVIQDSETTWALLDTTKERLKSKGGLEEGRKDWEVSIIRRNLLSEAIGYWYQMRNQELYNQGITRLDNTTNIQVDEISQARQDYDVEDLRDKELTLLGMKTDIALMFQFNSSEQARLYNRIDSRTLPNGSKKTTKINRTLSCTIDSQLEKQGNTVLEAQYASQVEKIRNNTNQKAAVYELNQLAREISSKALTLHAEQLNEIEKEFLSREKIAEQLREEQVAQLIARQELLAKLGEEVNPEEIELLKAAPLGVERKPLIASRQSQSYYKALSVLSSWVADELVALNQKRLTTVLAEIQSMYVQYKEPIWHGVSSDVGVIRDLLYEIYDYTLIDYLVGYERVAFVNKAMLHHCKLNPELSSRDTEIDHTIVDQFAALVETSSYAGFPRSSLKNKFQNLQSLEKAVTAETLGDGFNKTIAVTRKSSVNPIQEVRSDSALEAVKVKLSRNGFAIATKEEVLTFVNNEGYSIEVGAYAGADGAIKMIKRFKKKIPKLIYLSKKYQENRTIILKVLIGHEIELDSITNLQERIEFGDIRSFSDIRSDIEL